MNSEKTPENTHSLRPFLLILIFVLVLFSIYKIGQRFLFKESTIFVNEKPEIGFVAPDFIIEDVYGMKLSLSAVYKKKPALLVFWSTWCPFCAQELPDLMLFGQKYKDKVQVILVASGESQESIRNYVQEKNITFLTSLDKNRRIWQRYKVTGTPYHFLIGSDGKIIAIYPALLSAHSLESIGVKF